MIALLVKQPWFRSLLIITLNISCLSFLAWNVSAKKWDDNLISGPLYVTTCFSLRSFRILSLSLGIALLIMMFLGVGLFVFRTLWASLTCVSFSITRFGKFLVIISSIRFSNPCSLSSHSGILMIQMLLHFMLSKMFPKSFSFFKMIFVFAALPRCYFLSSKSLMRSSASSNLLFIPPSVLFISNISFFFFWLVLFYGFCVFFLILLTILITITLNSPSDKLLASISSSSSGEFSCSLIWGLFICLPILDVFCICFYRLLGRSSKTLLYAFVRRWLWLALGNLFGAINYPQLLAPSAGPGCVQNERGCAPRLALPALDLGGVS